MTRITAACAAVASIACVGSLDRLAGQRTEFRDSAGIRIVENTRPPEGSRLDWRLGPEPLVSIGRMEGEEPYLLVDVNGATMLSDGRIVIMDDGTKELRIFDGSGTYLETWAGRGEGPGEFRAGNQLWGIVAVPGDSVIVWHFWYPQVSVFGPDGGLVRRLIPERSRWGDWDRRGHLWVHDVTRGGLILAGQDWVYFDPVDMEVWDAAGELRGSLGAHPVEGPIRRGEESPNVMFSPYFFQRVWGDQFVVGPSDRYEFRAFALDGSLARIVRLDHVPRAPTEAHVETYIEERLSYIPSERTEQLRERRRELNAMPVAEHLPAYSFFTDDALGYLWVYEYEAPGEETPGRLCTIFDPEGRVLGYFEAPEGMAFLEIGADYILALVRNDLDVESVQLWPLERGGR